MADTYKTILAASEGLFKDKGSKFISHAHPVQNTEEVREILKEYKKRYFDARHICYAYVIGPEKLDFRANDDGEPSGTAGRPILGQITSADLTDILVVVIRYFGGVLLGTSGLIHAYKEATIDALAQAEITEKVITSNIRARYDYTLTNEVMRIAKDTGAQIANLEYDEACSIRLSIRKDDYDTLYGKLNALYGLKIIDD